MTAASQHHSLTGLVQSREGSWLHGRSYGSVIYAARLHSGHLLFEACDGADLGQEKTPKGEIHLPKGIMRASELKTSVEHNKLDSGGYRTLTDWIPRKAQ